MGDVVLHHSVEGEGEPVVLIHGVGSAAKDWSGVMTHLPHGFRVLRFDLRGHGASQKPPGPYRIQDFTGDLVALMDAVGFERAHVAGFSLGGLIAQSLALSHPERVDRLALLSTVAGRTEKERERVQGRLDFIASSHPAAYFDQSVPRWFTPGFIAENPDLIAEKKRIVSSMDQAAYAAAYHALAFTDFGEDLSAIRAETLVATGENDIGSNPRMARFMATTIPHARLRILPDLHHSILIEAPGLVAGMLAEFFQDGTVKETP